MGSNCCSTRAVIALWVLTVAQQELCCSMGSNCCSTGAVLLLLLLYTVERLKKAGMKTFYTVQNGNMQVTVANQVSANMWLHGL